MNVVFDLREKRVVFENSLRREKRVVFCIVMRGMNVDVVMVEILRATVVVVKMISRRADVEIDKKMRMKNDLWKIWMAMNVACEIRETAMNVAFREIDEKMKTPSLVAFS